MRGKIKLWISLTLCVAAGTVMAAGLGPQSYAQDGLVTQFDVLDNEGTGTYNPSAATWRRPQGFGLHHPAGGRELDGPLP